MSEPRFDWQRLLIGSTPWPFLAEVLVRTACLYVVLVIVVRLFGKRLGGRVGTLELAVLLALGAVVAVPFQDPASGVLSGVVLFVSLLALQRSLSGLEARSRKVEVLVQNRGTALVSNGELAIARLREASISTPELFAVLRGQGLRHLGQAKRVYLEAHGTFSILRQDPPSPGLSVAPDWDVGADDRAAKVAATVACTRCGATRQSVANDAGTEACVRCAARSWAPALSGN